MSTGAAGFVRVEFLEPDGSPVPGYSGDSAYELFGDSAEIKTLFWRDTDTVNRRVTGDLSALEGKTVRLRFTLREAKLYAMQFIKDSI